MNKSIYLTTCFAVILCASLFSCERKKDIVPEKVVSFEEQKILNCISKIKAQGCNDEFLKILDKIYADPTTFYLEMTETIENDTAKLLLLVDKKNLISENFVPEDLVKIKKNSHYAINRTDLSLRKPVEEALCTMADAAKAEGITLLVSSTYRSYNYQKTIYERNVAQMGKAAADRESASPGSSQHQLGTVIDFGSITDEFAETKSGKWLANNASDYGFSLSFPQGYESVTGFRWECWHYRFVGKKAIELQKKWFDNIQQYMIEFVNCWISI